MAALILLGVPGLEARLVEYDLVIEEAQWAPPGRKPTRAITVNGGIPGPTLRFRLGDTARIRVHNRLKNEDTSIHWHGLLLPNEQDGVPDVTTPPIKPGTTHTFEFPIIHTGTYWYHSHTGFQEQIGVFGSIVIEDALGPKVDREEVIVLSDWSREKPEEIARSLMRGTEWYEIQKGTAQSLFGAIRAGRFKDFWERERTRMLPMDISDIAYDAFLANGSETIQLGGRPGERIKLRIINASAATYFYVESATGPLTIVAADGPAVEPIKVKRLLVSMAETYDVIVTVPPSGEWEVRATAQDGSGHASFWIGSGEKHPAPEIPKADNYRMDDHLFAALHQPDEGGLSDAEALAKEPPRPLSPYARLRALESTELPAHLPRRTITLRATGDMERYVWGFNGKTYAEDGVIPIKRGEVLRLEFTNDTMMHHPLHLHGHFFRVLMGQGKRSPLKHTIDLPPMSKRVVEFEANDEGDWLFHCHLLYHMHAGMTRIFSYQDDDWVPPASDEPAQAPSHGAHHAPAAPQSHGGHGDHGAGSGLTHTPHAGGHDHDPIAFLFNGDFLQNYAEGAAALRNSKNDWFATWETGYEEFDHAKFELGWRRYLDPNHGYTAALRYEETARRRVNLALGYDYRLPFLIWSRVEVDTSFAARVSLRKELPLTGRLHAFGAIEYDTRDEWEWRYGGRFYVSKWANLIVQHHSRYGFGFGVGITY